MRTGGNFHPEWGYLAPAPSFMRTARIVAVATAIGATAGAAVVLSLAGSSSNAGIQADSGKSLVVVHSFVQPAEAAPSVALQGAPAADAGAAIVTIPTPEPAAQASAQPSGGNLVAPLAPAAQVSPPAASESHTVSTPAVPASVAALAEIPPATAVSTAPVRPAPVVFAPDQTGAAKDGAKKPRAADPAVQHGLQAAAAPAKKKPEERGLAPLLRHLFSARAGSSYFSN